jgi:hypothetical protein
MFKAIKEFIFGRPGWMPAPVAPAVEVAAPPVLTQAVEPTETSVSSAAAADPVGTPVLAPAKKARKATVRKAKKSKAV